METNNKFMYWYRIVTEKVIQLMDFTNGTIVKIPESKIDEVEAYGKYKRGNCLDI
ncbi:hypothetical protein [Evansella cellulosilytica]|uniref:Uncharacterized protein n=1 Tax=Evansella cellulosilytica (strain ATCC 21833 / DSM 2522 / FERM P-1141 / JCM 9156 / N-4) TaxID=649639 RepID=E6TVF5_EVAC2|nr:hypothetical protein [Evansella cellulosilytica]ADU30972.1 hypothetical protein Bcell_2717 [Evansella cellulosilytica DSM 2522]